jgi:hypothetical protein
LAVAFAVLGAGSPAIFAVDLLIVTARAKSEDRGQARSHNSNCHSKGKDRGQARSHNSNCNSKGKDRGQARSHDSLPVP